MSLTLSLTMNITVDDDRDDEIKAATGEFKAFLEEVRDEFAGEMRPGESFGGSLTINGEVACNVNHQVRDINSETP